MSAPTAHQEESRRLVSTEEIDAKVAELEADLLNLRIAKATRKEFKTHQFKHAKRAVAQLLTVRREKEIEQGINARESRRMAKHAALAKEKALFRDMNVVVQRPKSTKLRAKAGAAAKAARGPEFYVVGADGK